MTTTIHIIGNDVVFRVHRDTSKVLADGSPDPAWVHEVTFPCLPTDGRTLAQHLITCQQEAETQAAAAPRKVLQQYAPLSQWQVAPLDAVTVAQRQAAEAERRAAILKALGQTEEERVRLARFEKGLTLRVVGNSIVARAHLDTAQVLADGVPDPSWVREWTWDALVPIGQMMEVYLVSCKREALALAEYEMKRRMPPPSLNR